MRQAAGEKDEPQTVRGREAGLLDSPMEDDQLLPKQGILGNELGFTTRQVGRPVQHQGRASGLGEMAEGLIQERKKAGEEVAR
jgi:hypothetical protein